MDHLQQLSRITDELLFQEKPGDLRKAAKLLHSLLSEIVGIDDASCDPDDLRSSVLTHGEAIAPLDAARCVLDYARTSEFLRGIYDAVIEAQRRFPGGPVHILYAGCGPFAPLAIPLTRRFSDKELKITFLDQHSRSLDYVRRIVQSLGLAPFVEGYVQADAAYYSHGFHEPLHIVITETMQKGLEKEPQVAITLNLARQLCPGGIFIPEKVTVDACLVDLNKEFLMLPSGDTEYGFLPKDLEERRVRINLGQVFEITAENSRWLTEALYKDPSSAEPCLPAGSIVIPAGLDERFSLVLLTEVKIFQSRALSDYVSGITCPFALRNIRLTEGMRIAFRYCIGSMPSFRYDLATDASL